VSPRHDGKNGTNPESSTVLPTVGKVILTNLSGLQAKYGDGITEIQAALDALIVADAQRGLTTKVIGIDDAAAMDEHSAPTVTDPADPEQAKAAVDAVYAALTPSYVMLLGAIDVVPHQPLENPLLSDADTDASAWGDLPYACDEPYSTSTGDFVGPTRVVGRLPDITGASDPAYLVGLIQTASSWQSRTTDDYRSALGISAKVWEGSTRLSLTNLFGAVQELDLSPAEGPNWPSPLLSRRTHFINCHGAESDSHFYGQEGNAFPVAHDATVVAEHVAEGTVVAAECCYGAQLYDPQQVGGVAGLCNAYLAGQAYGFFGSSTIAYGPAEGNGSADLLCQYFVRHVLEGSSLGRAALEARHDFVRNATVVDPADLKTLAQFSLMGDPSIHPVLAQTDVIPAPAKSQKGLPMSALLALRGRRVRRTNLSADGSALAASAAVARKRVEPPDDRQGMSSNILQLANVPELRSGTMLSFDVDRSMASATGTKSVPWAKTLPSAPPPRVHVVVGTSDDGPAPVARVIAVVAKEGNGTILSFRKLFSK
jgi:hypothetical protein